MKLHTIESGGQKFIFNVIKNTTQPCSHCGVPACGKEDIIWYEYNNQKIAIIFDGGYFDLGLSDFFKGNINPENYDSLPEFMKEWSEARGWEDCWDYEGYEIQIDDFLRSIDLLLTGKIGKWMRKEELNDMRQLALEAKAKKSKLKIVRG